MKKNLIPVLLLVGVLAVPVRAAELEAPPGLHAGTKAPEFTAATHEGDTVSLSGLLSEGPVVLVFYRGAWCPYCNLHLRQFQAALPDLEALGARVLGISVDLKDYGKKTVIENELGFPVLSDSNIEILTAYNLVFRIPDDLAAKYKNEYGLDLKKHSGRGDNVLAVPATYVIDRDGTILFGYANKDYKVRTSPKEVIDVLKSREGRAS